MTSPSPVPGTLTTEPVAGAAIQFNGTVSTLVQIFTTLAGNTDGTYMNISFGPNGTVRDVRLSGPTLNASFSNRDWIILPQDGSPLVVLPNDEFRRRFKPATGPLPEPVPDPAPAPDATA